MIAYPPARRAPDSEDYHGETVADPYRWLEDATSLETVDWLDAQDRLTESFLSTVPSRETRRDRLRQLWDYPKFGAPWERGGRWFQWRQSGLEDQPRLYVMEAPDAEGRLLLDPNQLSEDGTVAVTAAEVDSAGTMLAYATSAGGSDWMAWRVLHVESGTDSGDLVEWSKFSGAAWRHDGSGFYYGGFPGGSVSGAELTAENRFERVLFHRLGTPQSEDETVFWAPEEPDWTPYATVSEDGRFLVIHIQRAIFPENQVRILDLDDPGSGLLPLVGDFSCQARFIGNVGETLYLLTDHHAERKRVVRAALGDSSRASWSEVVAETPDTLLSAHIFGGRLVCHYLRDAHSVLRVYSLSGTHLHDIALPGIASVSGHPGQEGIEGRAQSDVVHFVVTSFSESGSVWEHHLGQGKTVCVKASGAPLDSAAFVTEQFFATSPDGTRVPMFLTRRRDVEAGGDSPVLLYGYGGFDIPITPSFSVLHAAWLESGGVLAVANLRGGGEYGRSWYDAGRLANKQNVFDDFCACARWLASSGWSSPQRIAINGGSNGGLLVGACLTQHPEIFGAAIAEVGVFDMLRFHKFTIGWAWVSDFGDPDDPEQYAWLRAYSPLHNVVPGRAYPPTLLMTGDHDDRVVPGHSFKFAATLQAAQGGEAPILIRVDRSAGHGAGKPTAKVIEAGADMLAFLDATIGRPRGDDRQAAGGRAQAVANPGSGARSGDDRVGGEAGQEPDEKPQS